VHHALLAVTLVTAVLAPAACGDDGDPTATHRAGQVRAAALDAGVPDDVADLLALAASASGATFQVTYRGDDGAELVVSQRPPDRRVDVVASGEVVQSRVARGSTTYRCDPLDGALRCRRDGGSWRGPGAFSERALDELLEALTRARDAYDLTVEERVVAGTDASCLLTALRPGAEADDRGATGTLCLSEEGVQLLVDSGGERLEATGYTTRVPEGTFDVE
jgi:hypothetical protein